MSGGSGNVRLSGAQDRSGLSSGNTDFVFIGRSKTFNHSLMGKPEISDRDLKGKRIVVGRIGGNAHYFTQYGMRQRGSTRLKTPINSDGGAPETFLALSTGASTPLLHDAADTARRFRFQLRH